MPGVINKPRKDPRQSPPASILLIRRHRSHDFPLQGQFFSFCESFSLPFHSSSSGDETLFSQKSRTFLIARVNLMIIDDGPAVGAELFTWVGSEDGNAWASRVMEAMLQPRYCRPPTPCRTTDTHNLIHHGATDAALRPLPFCSNRSHRRFTSPIKMHRTPQETERNAYRSAESNLGFYLGLLRHATSPRDVLIAWRTRCF